jgi:hypothetical protein
MNPFPADDARLKALILHIASRCADWEPFDLAMLDRILFQADFLHFRLHGFPITGQTYLRGIHAPSPLPMRRMLKDLARYGALEVSETPRGDGLHVRHVPIALREPDLRPFDGQEIAVVERVLWFYRTRWISGAGPELLDLPWELAGPKEEIPYVLALVGAHPAAPATAPVLPAPAAEKSGLPLLARHALILAD